MKDEIKEINIPNDILAILGDLTNGAINYYKNPKVIELKYKLLLDYITNLQQEKEDYKSRCEKAVEYNNQIIKDTKDFYRPTTDIIYSGDSLIEIATNNIKILQNGSDSQ